MVKLSRTYIKKSADKDLIVITYSWMMLEKPGPEMYIHPLQLAMLHCNKNNFSLSLSKTQIYRQGHWTPHFGWFQRKKSKFHHYSSHIQKILMEAEIQSYGNSSSLWDRTMGMFGYEEKIMHILQHEIWR